MSDEPTRRVVGRTALAATAVAETGNADGAPPPDELLPPALGRYEVVRRIGAGGMGVVYEGHDPQLDRPVAIKVLHERASARDHLAERLHREARALARVTHPNVVSVFDVGLDDGEVYVVMQFVAGQTLDGALAARRHDEREVLALFAAAGRGLAAAHAAELVHRDFKPSNVLVDADGTVRVTDFGLARLSDLAETPAPDGALALSMTRGELVGTPAYMAPEQFAGGAITAAADQFSFCVALWEALCGQRPFDGDSVATIREAVLAGAVRTPPARRLSSRLERVLRRGLALDPARRFPGMAALLDALEPQRWPARVALGVLGVAAVSSAAFALAAPGKQARVDPCRGVDGEIETVWPAARRAELRTALAAVDYPGAATLADAAIAALDARMTRWRGARIEVCLAHRVHRTESVELHERRVRCLDRSLRAHDAVVERMLRNPGIKTLIQAADRSDMAIDPGRCSAAALANSSTTGIRNDEMLEPLQPAVARWIAAQWAGAQREVIATGFPLAIVSSVGGDHATAGQIWLEVGMALSATNSMDQARAVLRLAAESATAAGDESTAVAAWTQAAYGAATSGDLDAIDDLISAARGAALRSGDPASQATLAATLGDIANERRDHEAALVECRRAIAIVEPMGDAYAALLREAHGCLVIAHGRLGQPREALAAAHDHVALSERAYGHDHPLTTNARHRLAMALAATGELAQARTLWREVQDAYRHSDGEDSVALMQVLADQALGESPGGTTSTPEARDAIAKAVAIAERRLAPDDHERARMYQIQAWVLWPLGEIDGAAAAFHKAIAILERHDDPGELATALINLADLEKERGRCDAAAPILARAIEATVRAELRFETAVAGGMRGWCLSATGRHADGEAMMARAVADLEQLGRTVQAALARSQLGRAQWRRGARAQGIAEVRRARATLPADDAEAAELARQLDEWLTHPD